MNTTKSVLGEEEVFFSHWHLLTSFLKFFISGYTHCLTNIPVPVFWKILLQNNNKATEKVNIYHKTPKHLVLFRSKKSRPSTSLPRQDFVTIHSSCMHLCIGAAEAGIPFCTSPCSNWLYAKWPEGWDAPEVGGGAPDVGGALNEPTNIRKKPLKYHKL